MNPEPINDWKLAAVLLYFRMFGRRCVACSRAVDADTAKLWRMGDEVVLTHEGCE